MNNILSYNDFFQDVETLVYAKEINEGTGIKGFFNKRAGKKVAKKLEEEIEMSKSIMDGISQGLEKLNDNFDAIKKDISDKNKELKGERQKQLDEITKILEDSRKQTWDLQELIDEGEIDYAGFTANAGLATVTYFGILLFPVRSGVILHKSYNYFFSLVKNTIRKALVMLQLNFDQFQNLIIYQSFVSADYIQDMQSASDISEFYGKLVQSIVGEKGAIKNKKTADTVEKAMTAYKKKFDMEEMLRKNSKNNNPYNMLDQYNNTYTKTLESLRQYSQEDVQKELDGIKNSMNKLAGGDVDLQAYGELLIAMAEEHAYKVSSSIYNKFAKMSEVFSLPNQKQMIKLITDAAEEEETEKANNVKKLKDEEEKKFNEEKADELEKDGTEIFKSLSGSELGEYNKDEKKYSDVKGANWTYDEFEKLDSEKQDRFEQWLQVHKEVWEKCDDTLKIAIPMPPGVMRGGYFDYIDTLIDYIGPCVILNESNSNIMDFNEYVLNEAKVKPKSSKKYYINLKKSEDQLDEIKEMFDDNENLARIAFKVIGNKFSKNKFLENADKIIDKIKKALVAKSPKYKEEISESTYNILTKVISDLKDARSHDYTVLINSESNSEDKKEKSEE